MMSLKGSSVRFQHGRLLLVLLPLIFLSYDIGRHAFVVQGVPTFFVEDRPEVQIILEEDAESSGVLQISDAFLSRGVIKLTTLRGEVFSLPGFDRCLPLQSGKVYTLQEVGPGVEVCSQRWMSAAQRIALGIPLHPDRMSAADWTYLPGIGSALSAAIEDSRQINGDYGDVEALVRVKGVGPKRIKSWKVFF